jgi:hypothetical protein
MIVKIGSQKIYCYIDETFVIIDRNALITNAPIIGAAWAAGKGRNGTIPTDIPTTEIKASSVYHNMVVSDLIKIAEQQQKEV